MSSEQAAEYSKFLKEILFIIVIYECKIHDSVSFQSLQKELALYSNIDLFIYDNSSERQGIPPSTIAIHYINNPLNPGVSIAYNEGYKKAIELEKSWLFLLDQDSKLPLSCFLDYFYCKNYYLNHRAFTSLLIDKRGVISPFQLTWGKGDRKKKKPLSGIYSFNRWAFINSGLLISTELFHSAGGYDELFALDFSDLMFNERLGHLSTEFILTNNTFHHLLSSSNDSLEKTEKVLVRFNLFCSSARIFKKKSFRYVSLVYLLLPRAIKLTWIKKDIRFLIVASRNLI
jgi:GT2 family glycosyltransferase